MRKQGRNRLAVAVRVAISPMAIAPLYDAVALEASKDLDFKPTLYGSAATTRRNCDSILQNGFYDISQSASREQAESVHKASFCSYDYSSTDISSSTKATIQAEYKFFSASGSYETDDRKVIQTQKQVCTSGFDSSKYLKDTSNYTKTVHDRVVDAWDRCQSLGDKGVIFDLETDATLSGAVVTVITAAGMQARLLGVSTVGKGKSICVTNVGSGRVPINEDTVMTIDSNTVITITCNRDKRLEGDDEVMDEQMLVVSTSVGNYTVPFSATTLAGTSTIDLIQREVQGTFDARFKGAVLSVNAETCPPGWEPYTGAQGRVIVGKNADFAFGATGGLAQTTLTVDQMPAHMHGGERTQRFYIADSWSTIDGGKWRLKGPDMGSDYGFFVLHENRPWPYDTGDGLKVQTSVGGGRPVDILPPYKALTLCTKS